MGVLSETILDIMKLLKSSDQDKMKDRLTKYVKNFERKDELAGDGEEANKGKTSKAEG